MAAPGRTHEQVLAEGAQAHGHQQRSRQQLARFAVIIFIVGIWLLQTAYVTYFAVKDPLILDDVEKFIALIGVTGIVAGQIIGKLWPENGN